MASKFTVNDQIVADSLDAINVARDTTSTPLIIIGGIAIQTYASPFLPESIRPTNDLDYLVERRLTAAQFRSEIAPMVATSLHHYNPEVSVGRRVFEVKVEDDDEVPFFIHSYKYSTEGFERVRRSVERQFATANPVQSPNQKSTLYLSRPEEIISDKATRLSRLKELGKLPESLDAFYVELQRRDWDLLGSLDLTEWLEDLSHQKAQLPAFYDAGREQFERATNGYVGSKDLYDISTLSKLAVGRNIDFDDKYLDRILDGTE